MHLYSSPCLSHWWCFKENIVSGELSNEPLVYEVLLHLCSKSAHVRLFFFLPSRKILKSPAMFLTQKMTVIFRLDYIDEK